MSASVDLPGDDAKFPPGPHVDVVNANCTACHSASMATTQPALSVEQWKATVTKMRETYKAPIAEGEEMKPLIGETLALLYRERR